jgi:regulator of sigma D
MTVTLTRHDPGHHALLCAVCNQAIADYFLLRKHNAIRWGKVRAVKPRKNHPSHVCRDITHIECQELVEFIRCDLCRLLEMVGMDVTSGDVVKRIAQLEKTEEWKRLMPEVGR